MYSLIVCVLFLAISFYLLLALSCPLFPDLPADRKQSSKQKSIGPYRWYITYAEVKPQKPTSEQQLCLEHQMLTVG